MSPSEMSSDSSESDISDEDDALIEDEERQNASRRFGGDYTEEEMEILDLWVEADNYAELLDLNRQFLNGGLPFTCYSAGTTYFETEPLIPTLLRLHDYGLLTLESQPSEDGPPKKLRCPGCMMCAGKLEWSQKKQCAFLTFLLPVHASRIPQATLEKFLTELMVDDYLYVSITSTGKRCRRGACLAQAQETGNFPKDWTTHLEKEANRKENLALAKAKPRRHIEPGCTCVLSRFRTDEEIMETVQPLVINVLARSWTEEDLPGKVESAALRAGMERLYEEGLESIALMRVRMEVRSLREQTG